MVDASQPVRARVRHEPDRSCAVFVDGPDGQWVGIVAVGEDAVPDDLLEVGLTGLAHWFAAESAWMVSGPWVGGIYPGEYLDLEPEISAVEVEQMREHLQRARRL